MDSKSLLSLRKISGSDYLRENPNRGRTLYNAELKFTYHQISDCLFVYGKGQAVFPLSSDGYPRPEALISDSWISGERGALYQGERLRDGLDRPLEQVDQAAAIAPTSADTFWHWIYEGFINILALEASGYTGKYIVLDSVPWAKECFSLFGIREERMLSCHYRYVIKELVIPKQNNPSDKYKEYRSRVGLFRRRILDAVSILPGRKYCYVKRVGRRKIANENEVLEILEKYGFEILIPEEHGLRSQFQYMTNVVVSVMAHGANNSLTVAQPEYSGMIEFFNKRFMSYTALHNADVNKMLYIPLAPPGRILPENCREFSSGSLDIRVDISSFKVVLANCINFIERR